MGAVKRVITVGQLVNVVKTFHEDTKDWPSQGAILRQLRAGWATVRPVLQQAYKVKSLALVGGKVMPANTNAATDPAPSAPSKSKAKPKAPKPRVGPAVAKAHPRSHETDCPVCGVEGSILLDAAVTRLGELAMHQWLRNRLLKQPEGESVLPPPKLNGEEDE